MEGTWHDRWELPDQRRADTVFEGKVYRVVGDLQSDGTLSIRIGQQYDDAFGEEAFAWREEYCSLTGNRTSLDELFEAIKADFGKALTLCVL